MGRTISASRSAVSFKYNIIIGCIYPCQWLHLCIEETKAQNTHPTWHPQCPCHPLTQPTSNHGSKIKIARIWKLQAPWLITELLNHLWKSLSVGMIVSRLAACGGATAGAPACLKLSVSGPSGGQMPQSSSNAQSSCNCLNDAQTVAWGTDKPTSNSI